MRIFNSVLFTQPPFFREIDGGRVLERDSSSYPFMIEEIISYGAISIGVPSRGLSIYALDSLPPILKRRIKIIDKDLRIFRMDRALREPICREFGLMRIHDGFGLKFDLPLPPPVEEAILWLEADWYKFMLGLEYNLQIDVDVTRMREAAILLRRHAKDRATRAVLATIAGILAPYVPMDTGVIETIPMESDELIQTFRALVEDETYRAISKEFHGIGFPVRLRQGLSRISTLAKRLVRNRKFKSIVTVSTKTITAATQVPLPDGELAERLLRKQYLPPTLSLASALEKARQAWERSGSEFSALDFRGQQDKSSISDKQRHYLQDSAGD
jgi:hypothetical protein